MVFKRKIYSKMLEWKTVSHGESALMIEGARRIGKSTIALAFAKNEYEDHMILDFAQESQDVRRNFEENIGELDVFFRNLFLLKGRDLPKGKSVIIFDEVQLFPAARQAIKFLVQDGRYDYIETGSLISIKKNVSDILIPSEEFKIKMFPMDFEEFLWAKSDTVTADAIRYAFEKKKPLGDAVHRKIMQTFRTYMAVGGMPQAVSAFVEGRTYREIDFIKRNILSLYEDDLKKHDNDSNEKASIIFKTIPEQLSNRNSHFRMAGVEKNARYQNYIGAIDIYAGNKNAHRGVDIKNNGNPTQDVYAVADGKVIAVNNSCPHNDRACNCGDSYGNYVFIQHDINGVVYQICTLITKFYNCQCWSKYFEGFKNS